MINRKSFKQNKIKTVNPKQNLVLQQYLASQSNYVVCIDVTNLKVQGELLLAIDLAARTIIGHCYNSNTITTEQVCETLETIARHRSFLPHINIIHSDCGGIFLSKEYQECLLRLNIRDSKAIAYKHQNQVVERLNRTIKQLLRKEMNGKTWDKKLEPDPLDNATIKHHGMSQYVQNVIETYNNRPHTSLHGLSPNQMEEAFFTFRNKPSNVALIARNDDSLIANEIREYREQVASQYKGDWQKFFIEWRIKQEQQHQQVIQEISKSAEKASQYAEEARQRENKLSKEFNHLYDQYLEVQKQLEVVHQQALFTQKEREQREFLKLKKQQAKKLPLRDTITPEEFSFICNSIKEKPSYTNDRRTFAFVLLYLTGLRVTNLLNLNVRHINELMSKGSTKITLIKNGAKRFHLGLSFKGKNMLKRYRTLFINLCQGKEENDLVFTPKGKPQSAMRRDNFDKELNTILKEASLHLKKNIRTHSFRATIITELLKDTPIENVKEIMGHKSISSTLEYKRSTLSAQEVQKIHSKRNLLPKKKTKAKADSL